MFWMVVVMGKLVRLRTAILDFLANWPSAILKNEFRWTSTLSIGPTFTFWWNGIRIKWIVTECSGGCIRRANIAGNFSSCCNKYSNNSFRFQKLTYFFVVITLESKHIGYTKSETVWNFKHFLVTTTNMSADLTSIVYNQLPKMAVLNSKFETRKFG